MGKGCLCTTNIVLEILQDERLLQLPMGVMMSSDFIITA